MDIKLVKHSEIDKLKYNSCVHYAAHGHITGYSWYQDAVAREWDVLVEGDYESVMPLFYRKTWWGSNQLYMPDLIRSAGIYSIHVLSKPRVHQFLNSIPLHNGRGEVHLTEGTPWVEGTSWKHESKQSWVVSTQMSYEELSGNYSADYLRRLEAANSASLFPASASKPESLAGFWKSQTGKSKLHSPDVHALQRVQYQIAHRGWGSPVAAQDEEGNLLAFYYVGYTPGRISILLSAFSKKGLDVEAPAFLLDQLLQRHAGAPAVMDYLVTGSTHPELMAQLFQEVSATAISNFHIRR